MTNAVDVMNELQLLRKDIADLKQQRDDLLKACKAQEEADNWFGASDTSRILQNEAKELRESAIAKCKP